MGQTSGKGSANNGLPINPLYHHCDHILITTTTATSSTVYFTSLKPWRVPITASQVPGSCAYVRRGVRPSF